MNPSEPAGFFDMAAFRKWPIEEKSARFFDMAVFHKRSTEKNPRGSSMLSLEIFSLLTGILIFLLCRKPLFF
jgi:hypothetical protein